MKLQVIFNPKIRNRNEQMISGNILMEIYQEYSLLCFAENLSFKKKLHYRISTEYLHAFLKKEMHCVRVITLHDASCRLLLAQTHRFKVKHDSLAVSFTG